jgi:predicted ester cyclase
MRTAQAEANAAIVRRFIQDFQVRGDLEAFGELIHPEFVDNTRPPGVSPGPQGVLEQFQAFRSVLTEFDVRVVVQVAEDDLVCTHKIFSGVHAGELLGIQPSGMRLDLPVCDILRISEGRIVEHWGVLNLAPLLAAAAAGADA